MDCKQLKDKLTELGIRLDAYSLGNDSDESYCLERNRHNGMWEVYYSERGQKNAWKIFAEKSDACQYLLSELLKNSSARM